MNEIEAIEILNSKYHIEGPIKIVSDELGARVIAIKALEKQVPKKPLTKSCDHFQCPSCENITFPPCEGNVGLNYCGYCGQKID